MALDASPHPLLSAENLALVSMTAAVLAFGYYALFRIPWQRSLREQARRPLMEFRCIVRTGYGWGMYLGGFGRVSVYEDMLVAAYLQHNELEYSNIARAEIRQRGLGKGLFLYPKDGGRRKYVALITRRLPELAAALESRGVEVEGWRSP